MKEEIIVQPNGELEEKSIVTVPRFKGYTIQELRYRRALVAVKRDYVLGQIANEKSHILSLKFLKNGQHGTGAAKFMSRSAPIVSTILKGLSYMDYISIGLSLFGAGRKVFSWFRKKK